MNFSIVTKQNMGAFVFLILVILISQSRLVDFLFYTTLGRALFIFLFLLVGYLNKILGVVIVLLAILLINHRESNYSFLEGFTDTTSTSPDTSSTTPDTSSTTPDTSSPTPDTSSPTTTGTSSSSGINTKDASGNNIFDSVKNVITTKTSDLVKDPSGNIAAEGFDILGTENNLKRGKKSNSIPVNNATRKSDHVDPYYSSSFGDSYTLF